MKEKFQKALNVVNRFIQSDYFILFSAVIILIGWCFNIWAPMLAVLALVAILPLFFAKGTKQILCVVMMFTLIISSNRHRLDDYAWLLSLVVVLLAGALFNLIRYKRSLSLLSPTKSKVFTARSSRLQFRLHWAEQALPRKNRLPYWRLLRSFSWQAYPILSLWSPKTSRTEKAWRSIS